MQKNPEDSSLFIVWVGEQNHCVRYDNISNSWHKHKSKLWIQVNTKQKTENKKEEK